MTIDPTATTPATAAATTPGTAAETMHIDPYQQAEQAAAQLLELTGRQHQIAVVLGSGWLQAADSLGTMNHDIESSQVAGFAAAGVQGHAGRIRSITTEQGAAVLVIAGRTHLYEGRGVDAVAHGVRTARAAGCKVVILTNGCGGINTAFTPGTPVLISDHINYTGRTSLVGARFVDMSAAYSPRLRALAQEVDPSLGEGVYIQFAGPQYETPAEIRMARTMGADLVGMSTALEVIAAREVGLEVLGISLVTNVAAGLSDGTLSHAEVLAAGLAAAPRLGLLLRDIIARIQG